VSTGYDLVNGSGVNDPTHRFQRTCPVIIRYVTPGNLDQLACQSVFWQAVNRAAALTPPPPTWSAEQRHAPDGAHP
jgi:hypothetical protein